MNLVFHREGLRSFKTMTMADGIGQLGASLGGIVDALSADALEEAGFNPCTGFPRPGTQFPESISAPGKDQAGISPADLFGKQIQSYNEDREECDQIREQALIDGVETDPDRCVYISIDDVGVRHQKDARRDGGHKDGKVVENTVIHVQSSEGSHILTAVGIDKAFRYLLAFLFSNHLLEERHLIFFSDGAQNIRKGIETYFSFCPYVHYLDWYHLEKRMTELLSMALKGSKDDRHEIRYLLDRKLWAGNFAAARDYIVNLDKKYVKNYAKLSDAIDYLERREPYACCYALRSILNYRNSSNPAEKANDIIVANRQKHNGMSWSPAGSSSLAILTAAVKNNELEIFLKSGTIPFSMSSHTTDLAA